MTSKEDLVNIIKEWIEIDDKIKIIQNSMKELKLKKKTLTSNLLNIMKDNEIDCFDINSGKIVYCKTKTKAPINKKTLLDTLEKYFEDRKDIDVAAVSDFVLGNREIKLQENIKRK
tara:strand:- start:100 stop:447 length:348 start_codon:yes stop_codon:yes gene_type:complete